MCLSKRLLLRLLPVWLLHVYQTVFSCWSLISSRIRTSRSHESLLSNPSAMQAVDVTGRDTEVKAVHPSLLNQDHCFHVSTPHGSKIIACRTAEENDKWLSSLRRTMRPNQEFERRSDSSLKLWIVEAKNVQQKKRYFCEILLDRKLMARTSTKLMTDMLFWGEHFEFRDLAPVETITVNLLREADKKKKKDRNQVVCYINLLVADIPNKQYVEKWFNVSSGTVGKAGKECKGDLPQIRMKVRHQTVNILPMALYQDFSKYLMTDYHQLCELLEPALSVRDKEEFATMLVHAMHKLGKAKGFLCDIVMSEIGRLDNEHLTFRGNSIATKAMEAYMKLVGERYLRDTLGDFVRTLVESDEDCEVDPAKLTGNASLQNNQANLESYANLAWGKVINSYFYFPNELREVFSNFRQHCRDHGKEDFSDNLISGSIFLRFLCPAILSPSLFGLTQEYPQERSARNLTLIAKTIQTLANFTKFGGKEEFMTFMNVFVEREAVNMKDFLRKISSEECGNQFLHFEGDIDLGRELSLLHSVLIDFLDKASEATQKKFARLMVILTSLTKALDDPTVGYQHHASRKSQIFYDNMPASAASTSVLHPSASSPAHPTTLHHSLTSHHHQQQQHHSALHTVHSAPYLDTSPTEALRDMLRQCGESEEDLHAFAARAMRDTTRETESAPPGLLSGQQQQHGRGKVELDEFSALYSSASMTSSVSSSTCGGGSGSGGGGGGSGVRGEVGDVSVSSQRLTHDNVNETWNQMVSAADSNNVNGDYIDLIPFMDEEAQANSSLETEGSAVTATTTNNNNGSQISISQLSTVASSGYQSLGYSQSSSPVEPGGGHGQGLDLTRELTRSPIIHYPMQPLSFNNPLYRHQQLARHNHHHHHHHHHRQQHYQQVSTGAGQGGQGQQQQQSAAARTKDDSSSSLSSGDEASSTTTGPKPSGGNSSSNSSPPGKKSQLLKSLSSSSSSTPPSMDPLRKLSQLSSSSGSNDSLNDRPYAAHHHHHPHHDSKPPGGSGSSSATGGGAGDGVPAVGGVAARFTVGPRGCSPAQAQSSPRVEPRALSHGPPPEVPPRPDRLAGAKATSSSSKLRRGASEEYEDSPPVVPPRPERTSSYCGSSSPSPSGAADPQRNLGQRPYHLSHSMDFGCLQRQQADQLRRAATDSVIAKGGTPVHTKSSTASSSGSSGAVSSQAFSREDSLSSVHSSHSQGSLSNRRLSPQSQVHMGISSVQRKLQEQERTKQEYENEVHVLRQQLVEAQVRLQSAEMRLMDHEVETHQLMDEWQSRLAESEQRIRQQQAEKDGQMKSIIERLVTIEEELRREQADMQKVVQEKQQVIEVQEQRLRTLDNANAKLLQALADLKEHAGNNSSNNPATDNSNNNSNTLDSRRTGSNGTSRNGITGPMRAKLTAADFTGYKSSTC